MGIKMEPAKYWEWRVSVEELQHEELKVKFANYQLGMMEKDIEIAKLRAMLFKVQQVKAAQDKYDSVRKGYDNFRVDLEKELNIELKNKVIDEFTYEIRDIDEPKV